jgi:hypothetical protein
VFAGSSARAATPCRGAGEDKFYYTGGVLGKALAIIDGDVHEEWNRAPCSLLIRNTGLPAGSSHLPHCSKLIQGARASKVRVASDCFRPGL